MVSLPHVSGNHIVDGAGNTLILRGAHIDSSLEVVHPYVIPTQVLAGQHLTSATFDIMRNAWNMNAVRIGTSDYVWKANPSMYMATLQHVVADANQAGLYVILSLHEDLRGGAPNNEGGSRLPTDEALLYWHAVARTFKGNPMVLFDIYNEPHLQGKVGPTLTDQDWYLWLHGGTIGSVTVHGMQELVDTIRQAGAQQVIIVEALQDWFQTMNKNGTGSNFVQDPNIVYSAHLYFTSNVRGLQSWNAKFGDVSTTNNLLAQFPMFVGEWAFSANAAQSRCAGLTVQQAIDLTNSFLYYMEQNGMSWAAYAFTLKQLFLDYDNYTPTQLTVGDGEPPWTCGMPTPIAGDGAIVQQYLLSH